MSQWFTRFLLRLFSGSNRKVESLILLFVAAISVTGVYEMRKLQTSYSMRQFMPAENPLYKNDDLIHSTFNLAEEQPILVTAKKEPGWNPRASKPFSKRPVRSPR
jgi:predicted RND superfamily exporter protein